MKNAFEDDGFDKGQDLAFLELGKFLARFEYTTHSFREIIGEILKRKGLSEKIYSDILLAKLTAEPIFTYLQAMTPYYFQNNNITFVNDILVQFKYLIEIRNIIIHSYWAIGVGIQDYNEVTMIGIKQRVSKSGIAHYDLDFEIKEIRAINTTTQAFSEFASSLEDAIKAHQTEFGYLLNDDLKNIQFQNHILRFKKIMTSSLSEEIQHDSENRNVS